MSSCTCARCQGVEPKSGNSTTGSHTGRGSTICQAVQTAGHASGSGRNKAELVLLVARFSCCPCAISQIASGGLALSSAQCHAAAGPGGDPASLSSVSPSARAPFASPTITPTGAECCAATRASTFHWLLLSVRPLKDGSVQEHEHTASVCGGHHGDHYHHLYHYCHHILYDIWYIYDVL